MLTFCFSLWLSSLTFCSYHMLEYTPPYLNSKKKRKGFIEGCKFSYKKERENLKRLNFFILLITKYLHRKKDLKGKYNYFFSPYVLPIQIRVFSLSFPQLLFPSFPFLAILFPSFPFPSIFSFLF